MTHSLCETCGNKCYKKGTANGNMNADPDEEWCEYDSGNLMTDDGCFRYFEWVEDGDCTEIVHVLLRYG